MSTTHRITWCPRTIDLDEPSVSNRIADLGAVFVNVGREGQYIVSDAAAARAMGDAFYRAADLLDAGGEEGGGK